MQVFTFLWIGQLLKLSSYLMQLFFNFIALCSIGSYFCHPCKVCYALKSKPNSAVMNCAPYVPFSSHHGVKRYSSPFREEVLYVVIYKYCAQVVKNVPDHLELSGNLIQFKGFPQGRVVLCCQVEHYMERSCLGPLQSIFLGHLCNKDSIMIHLAVRRAKIPGRSVHFMVYPVCDAEVYSEDPGKVVMYCP